MDMDNEPSFLESSSAQFDDDREFGFDFSQPHKCSSSSACQECSSLTPILKHILQHLNESAHHKPQSDLSVSHDGFNQKLSWYFECESCSYRSFYREEIVIHTQKHHTYEKPRGSRTGVDELSRVARLPKLTHIHSPFEPARRQPLAGSNAPWSYDSFSFNRKRFSQRKPADPHSTKKFRISSTSTGQDTAESNDDSNPPVEKVQPVFPQPQLTDVASDSNDPEIKEEASVEGDSTPLVLPTDRLEDTYEDIDKGGGTPTAGIQSDLKYMPDSLGQLQKQHYQCQQDSPSAMQALAQPLSYSEPFPPYTHLPPHSIPLPKDNLAPSQNSRGGHFNFASQIEDGFVLVKLPNSKVVMIDVTYEKTVGHLVEEVRKEYPKCTVSVESNGMAFTFGTKLQRAFARGATVRVNGASTFVQAAEIPTTSQQTTDLELEDYTEKDTNYARVETVKQVVSMLEHIHNQVKDGRARSINDALRQINKDRKTVERFKHIYYIAMTDSTLLNKLEYQWKLNKQAGGLTKLDYECKSHLNPDTVIKEELNGNLTIFGRL